MRIEFEIEDEPEDICGVEIDKTEDPLMKKIQYMDKLVDELAKFVH